MNHDAAPPEGAVSPGPFTEHLGFRLVRADGEVALMQADPEAHHTNGGGILHGGYLSSLLDSVTGWAVHASLPPGTPAPHIQLTVQFLRAGLPGQPLEARATCTSSGRRICTSEAQVSQSGRVIARAVGTHAVLARPES